MGIKQENNEASYIQNELLIEAKENFNKAQEKIKQLSHELFRAEMVLLSASGDDNLLLEDEKALLAKKRSLLNEIFDNHDFWKKRVEMLEQYDYQRFYSQLEIENEYDNLLAYLLGES